MVPKTCPKCGCDIADPVAQKCPACSASLSRPKASVWLIALFQFCAATVFMLLFGFPRFMIIAFGAMIFTGTLLATVLPTRTSPVRPAVPKQTTHPMLYRALSIVLAIVTLALISTLLFGFVIFMNSWDRWHRYEGQRFHEANFIVKRTFYQKHSKGGADIFASGTVEGNSEWMSLRPALQVLPHDQGELESEVPAGTSIHVYYFPGMQGRARVQAYTDVPPAEASHREAMKTLNYALIGLALCAGAMFLVVQLRRLLCVEEPGAQSQVGPIVWEQR